ncbi:hypothetical protein Taro_026198, partial [Colocasia esculenta]|nr:hypothetical protein [Colocasia esculenta]
MVGRGSLGETRASRISLLKGERKFRSSSAGAFPSARWIIASMRRSSFLGQTRGSSRPQPIAADGGRQQSDWVNASGAPVPAPRTGLDANGAVSPPAHPEAPGGHEIVGATIPPAALMAEKPPEL